MPILLPGSSCVCMPSFSSVGPIICLTKVSFLALFWPPRAQYVILTIIFLETLIPRIYGVHGSNLQTEGATGRIWTIETTTLYIM